MRVLLLALALLWAPPAFAGTMLTSFYGYGEKLNRRTASGETFRPHALTAAHRTLRFGTRLRLAYRGRSVVVRVNDRGPARWTRRDLDISYGAARRLGFLKAGVVRLRAAVL